jgi:amino acid adenylation domain-containing protein
MNTAEFLAHLKSLNIQLSANGDKLRYKAPPGAVTPEIKQELQARKAEILPLLQAVQAAPSQRLPITPVDRSQRLPLSFAQQRLWFIDRLEGGTHAYNIPGCYQLAGTLNVEALEQSFQAMIQRHESLRTVFPDQNGDPYQCILPELAFSLALVDLQELPAPEQEVAAAQMIQQEGEQVFDLVQGPLVAAKLLRLAPQEHVLVLTVHHIIADAWSMGVFFRELAALYQAFVLGQPSPLGDLSVQYPDVAVWQRQRLQGQVLESQLTHWRQQLQGAPALLELPTDFPRPARQSYRGAHYPFKLPQSVLQGLQQLSQQEGASLFMTLLAAFKTLLYRYSHQNDIVVGSPIDNRTHVELENVIGFFVNTLAFRTDLSGHPSFRQVLRQVRRTALDAYVHQDIPFDKLVEELNPERSLSYSPLFQVMFVLQHQAASTLNLPDLAMAPRKLEPNMAKFDLTLFLQETSTGLKGNFEYSTDLFERSTISRLVGHFQILLQNLVTHPDQSIDDVPILSDTERQQLLVAWNQNHSEYPQDRCIHQLVEDQVERTPDAIAVIADGQSFTYRQLNDRANQLAHYLQSLGVGPDQLVGICLERSIEMVVGLLGILKAGGAYLPLDSTYPQQRLAFMVENAQARVIVTQDSLRQVLPPTTAPVVCLDTDWSTIAQHPASSPCPAAQPQNLAYVIYTSGSTGQPKGVLLNHRPLVNLVAWQIETSNLPVGAKTLQFSPISFDVSFQEIFATWCAGGTLVLIADDQRKDAIALVEFLQDYQIERLFLPFVALQHLVEIAQSRNQVCPALREVITAGEQLQITSAIAEWFSRHPHCRLHNHYGPSETHVVTAYTLSPDPKTWPALPPIGRAIPQTQLFILDPQGQPVPIGVAGELFIGVEDAVRGYIHRPDLTQSRFVPNPFSPNGGDRLYKTGDLVRYLPDGNIEYLGRIDQQVKIRGFRIEPGEVEAALSHHSAVQQVAVIVREDTPGDKRLVAYGVTAAAAEPLSTQNMRQFLQQSLPEYMIPAAFVPLEELPLTPSGKLDRRSLPQPDRSELTSASNYVAPCKPLEQQLAEIWAQVLNLEQVGIHDNFFDLGGHSLLAVQLFAQIEALLNHKLPLSILFKAPTIAEMATVIEEKNYDGAWSPLVEIQAGGSKPPLFCMHGGGFNVLIYRSLAQYLGPDYPVYGLQARGLNRDPSAPIHDIAACIEDFASDYIQEIRRIQPQGPYFLVGLSAGGNIAFEMAQQLQAAGEEVAFLGMFDSYGPDGLRLHAPLPRLLSSLHYLLRYSVPQFIQKAWAAGLTSTWRTLQTRIQELSARQSASATDQETQPQSTVNSSFQSRSRSWHHRLNASMDHISQFILTHSDWSFLTPSQQLQGQDNSIASNLKQLEKKYYQAHKAYVPQPYSGKITVFRAKQFPPGFKVNPQLGWGKVAQAGVEVFLIPGHHLTMMESSKLAKQVNACLEREQARLARAVEFTASPRVTVLR